MHDAPFDNPPTVSARELHELLLRSHASLNTSTKRFIDLLRSLHDMQLYLELGFPSVDAYAEATFRYRRARTREFIQVSRDLLALATLPPAPVSSSMPRHLSSPSLPSPVPLKAAASASTSPRGSPPSPRARPRRNGSPSSRAGGSARCSSSSRTRSRRSATIRGGM